MIEKLTKESQKALALMYRTYLRRRESGVSKSDATVFDIPSDEWSLLLEQYPPIEDSLDELSRQNCISQDLIGNVTIQDSAIAELETQLPTKSKSFFRFVLNSFHSFKIGPRLNDQSRFSAFIVAVVLYAAALYFKCQHRHLTALVLQFVAHAAIPHIYAVNRQLLTLSVAVADLDISEFAHVLLTSAYALSLSFSTPNAPLVISSSVANR